MVGSHLDRPIAAYLTHRHGRLFLRPTSFRSPARLLLHVIPGGHWEVRRAVLCRSILIPARDIMFTNPYTSKFFELGQVISTERGGGVFQPAMDKAVKLLQDGEWVGVSAWMRGTILTKDPHIPGGQSQPAKVQSARRYDPVQMGNVSSFMSRPDTRLTTAAGSSWIQR